MAITIGGEIATGIMALMQQVKRPVTSLEIAEVLKKHQLKHIASTLHYLTVERKVLKRTQARNEKGDRLIFSYSLADPGRNIELKPEGRGRVRFGPAKRKEESLPRPPKPHVNGSGSVARQPLLVLQYGERDTLTVTIQQARELWQQMKAFHRFFR